MVRSLLLLAFMPLAALAADDGRISFLEQEVRNLQRQVQALSRQVDELRTRPALPPDRSGNISPAPPVSSDTWIDAARWRRLRVGMSELEVIDVLGPPSSMREDNGTRVLLYAREIGSSGFLGGSVTLRDRAVVEVRTPTLQ